AQGPTLGGRQSARDQTSHAISQISIDKRRAPLRHAVSQVKTGIGDRSVVRRGGVAGGGTATTARGTGRRRDRRTSRDCADGNRARRNPGDTGSTNARR